MWKENPAFSHICQQKMNAACVKRRKNILRYSSENSSTLKTEAPSPVTSSAVMRVRAERGKPQFSVTPSAPSLTSFSASFRNNAL